MGEALDEHVDGLAEFAECTQGDPSHREDSPERSMDRRAPRGAKCPICLFAFLGETLVIVFLALPDP